MNLKGGRLRANKIIRYELEGKEKQTKIILYELEGREVESKQREEWRTMRRYH